MMLRYLLYLSALFFAYNISFGAIPNWENEQWRNVNYPRNTYYVGYASYSKLAQETKNEALNKAEEDAYNQLARQITVNISGSSISKLSAIEVDGHYSEADIFEDISTITSQVKVSNAKIESYYDIQSSTAYALVFVEKLELIELYHREYAFEIAKVEGYLNASKAMIQRNEKSAAKAECDSMLMRIPKLEDCVKMLVVIDPDFSHNSSLENITNYKIYAQELSSQLEQSITIDLKIEGDIEQKYKDLLYGVNNNAKVYQKIN